MTISCTSLFSPSHIALKVRTKLAALFIYRILKDRNPPPIQLPTPRCENSIAESNDLRRNWSLHSNKNSQLNFQNGKWNSIFQLTVFKSFPPKFKVTHRTCISGKEGNLTRCTQNFKYSFPEILFHSVLSRKLILNGCVCECTCQC